MLRLARFLLALILCAVPVRVYAAGSTDVQLSGIRDLGAAPAAMRVDIAVVLPYRHDAALDALIDAQDSPGATAHGFLSARAFAQEFSPSAPDYGRAIAFLRAHGFTVTRTFANRTVVDASGSVATADAVFGTDIHRVAQAGAGIRYAPARPETLPRALRALGADVVGLDNLQAVRPVVIGPPLTGPGGGAGPLKTAQGYDMPVQHGYDGTGRATGVIMCGDFSDDDIAQFLSTFNIVRTGPPTRRVEVDGGAPFYPPSNDPVNCSLEASLDVQTIVGNTPGTALSMYLVPTTLTIKQIIDTLNQVVVDDVVDVLSSSLAGCETQTGKLGKLAERIGRQGAAEGITFASSTGDSGSAECGSGPGVAAPADAPTWTAVGGTGLTTDANGNYLSETGATFGGGGYSVLFAEPHYQTRIANPLPNGRNVPDVAFAAKNVAVCYSGAFKLVSGVSWSAPIFSALQTQIDQVVGKRMGRVNGRLYGLAAKGTPGIFHDITTGSNGMYTAGPGYDNVTGIGSIDGYAFATALSR
jgi:subtilase family serine protease